MEECKALLYASSMINVSGVCVLAIEKKGREEGLERERYVSYYVCSK